jgi:hypothetical protein
MNYYCVGNVSLYYLYALRFVLYFQSETSTELLCCVLFSTFSVLSLMVLRCKCTYMYR